MKYFIFLLVCFYANASFALPTGNELLEQCKYIEKYDNKSLAGNDFQQLHQCISYVAGIRDTLLIADPKKWTKYICLPTTQISDGQAARIILKFLKDHPEMLHKHKAVLAMMAFMKAYPCTKNQ
jgi:hypothetical protein